jgi:tellurite resistance protein
VRNPFRRKRTLKDDNGDKVVAAGVTASIMMALVDGELAAAERERLLELSSAYGRGVKDPGEILETIDTHVSTVEEAGRDAWPAIMHTMAKDFSDE